ncbi:hypothetical protein ACOMHN_054938 [Nucella lapillus]
MSWLLTSTLRTWPWLLTSTMLQTSTMQTSWLLTSTVQTSWLLTSTMLLTSTVQTSWLLTSTVLLTSTQLARQADIPANSSKKFLDRLPPIPTFDTEISQSLLHLHVSSLDLLGWWIAYSILLHDCADSGLFFLKPLY